MRKPFQTRTKPSPKIERKKNKGGKKLLDQWTNDTLKDPMKAIDVEYKWREVCSHYGILRTLLKNHMSGRARSRKMEEIPILTKEEEGVVLYL